MTLYFIHLHIHIYQFLQELKSISQYLKKINIFIHGKLYNLLVFLEAGSYIQDEISQQC